MTFFALLLVLGYTALPVHASSGTAIVVDPSEASLPAGNQVLLQISVRDGIAVNAFDLTVTYDQAVLRLDSWAHGGYLQSLSCLHQSNQPGRLRLACTQVARPEVNGDGVLLALVFSGNVEGVTAVTISEAVLANRQGVQSQPERQHGTVNVLGIPKHTSTQTPIPTATRTPTPISTAVSAQSTPTPVVRVFTATLLPTGESSGEAYPVEPPVGQTSGDNFTPDKGVTPTGMGKEADPVDAEGTPGAAAETPGHETSATQTAVMALGAEGEENPWLVGLLWGLLGASGLAILGMVLILIRKKDAKSEELLL